MKSLSISVFIVLVTFSLPAMAYIDPGSGSAIMSAVIGLFVAAGLAVKTYWYKLKSVFSGKKDKNNSQERNSKEEK